MKTWCNSKTKKCWKKSICHKKLSKLFQANCLLWLPKAMTGLPKTTRLTGVSPCLRTDYGHVHWHRIWKLRRNKLAMRFTWTSGPLLLISQLSEALALEINQPKTPVLIPLDTDHTECQTSKVKTKQINSLTSIFSHNTEAPEIYVLILTFKPLWHSTIKIQSLGLISTRIHEVGVLCLVSTLKDLIHPRKLLYFFIKFKHLLATTDRK